MNREPKLRIRKITGTAGELTTEFLRLLVLYPYGDEIMKGIGVTKEEVAARMCQSLPGPGGALTTADNGRRLQGLLYLKPVLPISAALDAHVWHIQHLIVAPEAPKRTVFAMLEDSLAFLDTPVDWITTRIPAADVHGVEGLRACGFETVSGELVAVAKTPGAAKVKVKGARIVPFGLKHIEAATTISCGRRQCNPFVDVPGLDRTQVCDLSRQRLRPYAQGEDHGGLVALDADGRLNGFTTFRMDAEIAGIRGQRVASVDQLCVAANNGGRKLEKLLYRCLLNILSEAQIRSVITRKLITDRGSTSHVDSMETMGFEATQSNLIMHRWLTPPKARLA